MECGATTRLDSGEPFSCSTMLKTSITAMEKQLCQFCSDSGDIRVGDIHVGVWPLIKKFDDHRFRQQFLVIIKERVTKSCYGKTPMQTFLDTVPLAKEKMLTG